jgi:hypothetical protein
VTGWKWLEKLHSARGSSIYAVSLGKQQSLIYYIPTQDVLRTSFHLTQAQEESYRSFAGDGSQCAGAGHRG